MFQRIKNLVSLSKAPQQAIDNAVKAMQENQEMMGDGNAVFFGEGTEEELKLQTEKDKGFIGRIFGL